MEPERLIGWAIAVLVVFGLVLLAGCEKKNKGCAKKDIQEEE